jgi:hypothetical protein
MEFDRERSESAQLDPLTARHCIDNFVEYCIDDFLDVVKVEVRVLSMYAQNEIGPKHSKFLLGHDLAGTGTAADLRFFLMASLWLTSVDNPIDADSRRSAS